MRRYLKAKIKYLKYQYSSDEARIYLHQLDAKGLYDSEKMKKLSMFGFASEKVDNFTPKKIDKLVKKARKGIF